MRFIQDLSGRLPYRRFREKEDRRRRLIGQVLSLVAAILGIFYLIWHYFYINWAIWYLSVPFYIAEICGWLLVAFFALISWYRRYHDPNGISPDRLYAIDIFITTCGEPLEILEETLRAVAAIDYKIKQVYVLDDGKNPQVETLTPELGFHYLSRPERVDAKAGNLNFGLKHSKGELILTLDADQVPQPWIIKRLVGYFKFPRIAFVQSKQRFRVPPGDPFGNTDQIFYNVMQCGKDDDNSAFSCGSGVLYRRAALEEIGGFSTWNLVEDLHTSMFLHQKGWHSIYYNYPLSKGTAPTDIWSVYRQRSQWAADSLRIFFWDNPFFRRGLTWGQKFQYFHIGFVYLVAGWIMPIFFIIPIWTLFTSIPVVTAPVPLYILNRMPYFIITAVSYAILTSPTPFLHSFQIWTGLFPAFMKATVVALLHPRSKPRYRVNSKGKAKRRLAVIALFPQLLLIVGALLAILYGLFINTGPLDFRMLNCAWGTWAILILSGLCFGALSPISWEEMPEATWFTPKQFVQNLLQTIIFIFLIILIAVMIMQMGRL